MHKGPRNCKKTVAVCALKEHDSVMRIIYFIWFRLSVHDGEADLHLVSPLQMGPGFPNVER